MAKADYTVKWSKVGQEYVAHTAKHPDVTGHSREPAYALQALVIKIRELEGKARAEKPKGSFTAVKGRVSRS